MKSMVFLLLFMVSFLDAGLFVENTKVKAVVLYNGDIALVEAAGEFDIKKDGINTLVFSKIPKSVLSDSIRAKFSDSSTKLFYQTFKNETLSLDKVINYYKKHKLYIYFHKPFEDKKVLAKAKIVSFDGSRLLLEDGDSKVWTVSKRDLVFKDLPKELRDLSPKLLWRIKAKKGVQKIDLLYLARGIGWSANYLVDVDKTKADINGWIDIKNSSGVDYKDVKLYFVAGKVNGQREYNRVGILRKSVSFDTPVVKREPFMGYQLYKVPFSVDLEKGIMQIKFFTEKDVDIKEYAKARINFPLYFTRGVRDISFDHIIKTKNSFDTPLPGGSARVYAKSPKGVVLLSGKSRVPNMPKNSSMILNIGKYFDIKATVKQVDFRASSDRKEIYSKVYIRVKNSSNKKREIRLKVNYHSPGRFSVKSSCEGLCQKKRLQFGIDEYVMMLDKDKDYGFYIEFSKNR